MKGSSRATIYPKYQISHVLIRNLHIRGKTMFDSKLKILIVDDFEVMRFNMKKILKNLGLDQITEAVDGQDAWEKIQAASSEGNQFDVIFLDWNMPRMSGLEVLVNCKKDEKYKTTPIIMTTAEREQKSIIAALSSGASDYIVKPFNASVVQEKLSKQLQTKKAG